MNAVRTMPWRGWPGLIAAGLAAPVALASIDDLPHGGVGILAVAALAAAFVGVPLAILDWRTGESADERHVAARAFAQAWAVVAVGAALAPTVRDAGALGALGAVGAWTLGALAVRRLGEGAIVALIGALAVVAIADAGIHGWRAPPWTLIAPQISTWAAWTPGAVALGVTLAVGGGWAGRAALPGARRAPWLTVGAGVLLALIGALAAGARFEAGEVAALAPGVAVLAGLAGVGVVVGAEGAWTVVGGIVATLWFAWPAHAALGLWWHCGFPLAPLAIAVSLAARTRGTDRIVAALGAVVLIGAVIGGWVGFPDAASAGAIALVGCAGVWIAGAAAITARRPA